MGKGLDLRYLEDGLLVSGSGSWAWMRLRTHPYDLLGEEQRLRLRDELDRALIALRDAEAHLLVVPRPYSVETWTDELRRRTPNPQEGWEQYVARQTAHVAGQELWEREVYLGVWLGQRRRQSGLRAVKERTWERLGIEDPRMDAKDLTVARERAETVLRTVTAAGLRARAASAGELRWLVRRSMWRGLDEPATPEGRPAWGGELLALAEGTVLNGRRSLVIEQPSGASHVGILGFARLPDLEFPGGEWLYMYDVLPFPVEASVRLRVVPAAEAAKDTQRKLAAAMDQARHISGTSAVMPLAIQEVIDGAQSLEYALTKEGIPAIYSWPRFVLWGATGDELAQRSIRLVEWYADYRMELVRPAGEQLSLFLEALPGDRVRVSSYEQRSLPKHLAGGMPTATSSLGDGVGPYIGTASGLTRTPVHFDPLRAAEENRPTAIAVTGAPGNGKTNVSLLMAYQLVLRGVWTIAVDPKGDATGLTHLPGMSRAQVIRLDETYAGMLEPFRIEPDRAQAAMLAADLCRTFLPVTLGQEAEAHILDAAGAEALAERPTLGGIVRRLEDSDETLARQAGRTLRSLSRFPLARMCFPEEEAEATPLGLDDALTVIQFANLDLPDADTKPEQYRIQERLAVGLVVAVTSLVGRLMDGGTTSQPKAIVFDEAWAITRTGQGQDLVQRLARMGRSRNTTMLLVSQNAADLLDERVTNNFSGKFCFGANQEDEARAVLNLLNLEDSPANRATIVGLGNGECVFADVDGRIGRVQIDLVLPELAAAFDTTPKRGVAAAPSPQANTAPVSLVAR